ncbi:MAG TPA: hypothetical protein VN937_25415 [Blastocatellia bacterium]|nr:hypothetical protein [Blastocatellia bacterium]
MWEEYLKRLPFVVLHGVLLAAYLVAISFSLATYWRERGLLRIARKVLKSLEKDKAVLPVDNSLATLQRSRSVIAHALKQVVNRKAPEAIFDLAAYAQGARAAFTNQLSLALSTGDEFLRFCINGFVVIGLMGTLSAFYELWQKAQVAASAASEGAAGGTQNLPNLGDMATALVVSFAGLTLGLGTNFIFTVAKTARRRLLDSFSDLLDQLFTPIPVADRETAMVEKLIQPVKQLVEGLATQNRAVVDKLSQVVTERTRSFDDSFDRVMKEWKTVIDQFKKETLAAVTDLKDASIRLAKSSLQVSNSMSEVSRSLERTKDLGLIVQQLKNVSEDVVKQISERLDHATSDWAHTLTDSVQSHIHANEQQSHLLTEMIDKLTTKATADFQLALTSIQTSIDALTGKFFGEVDTLQGGFVNAVGSLKDTFIGETSNLKDTFITDSNALASKWMSAMERNTDTVKGVVSDWELQLSNTSTAIGSSLSGSRHYMNEMKGTVEVLHEHVSELQRVLIQLSQQGGAPVYLNKAVEEMAQTALRFTAATEDLGKVRAALEQVAENLRGSQSDQGLRAAIEQNSQVLRELVGHLQESDTDGDQDPQLQQALAKVETGFHNRMHQVEQKVVEVGEKNGLTISRTIQAVWDGVKETDKNVLGLQDYLIDRQFTKRLRRGWRRIRGEKTPLP